jgi:hypothetical protein
VYGVVGTWVAVRVFGVKTPVPDDYYDGDNGDSGEEWGRALAALVLGLMIAAVWTFVDRRRPGAAWVEEALRVLLRYAIVLGLTSYGLAKLWPQQFPPLSSSPEYLNSRVGDLNAFGLTHAFMEYSRPYNFIAGVAEMLVVALLCFRRTALLGALICLPVMANVVMINFFYAWPVKLFSSMITITAAVLVLLDARRLVDVVVRHRATEVAPPGLPFRSRRLNLLRWPLKVVVVGALLGLNLKDVVAYHDWSELRSRSALYGVWEVDAEAGSGTAPPWQRLTFGIYRGMMERREGALACAPEEEPVMQTLKLSCGEGHKAELHYTVDGDRLRLEGTLDGAAVVVSHHRMDLGKLRLMRQPFALFH